MSTKNRCIPEIALRARVEGKVFVKGFCGDETGTVTSD